jgi:hypothetical protein
VPAKGGAAAMPNGDDEGVPDIDRAQRPAAALLSGCGSSQEILRRLHSCGHGEARGKGLSAGPLGNGEDGWPRQREYASKRLTVLMTTAIGAVRSPRHSRQPMAAVLLAV